MRNKTVIAINDSMLADTPVNLRQLFGHRYQVGYDPAYYAEHGRKCRSDDPQLQIMLCHHGHIFVWGPQRLAASTDSRGAIANKLATLGCCQVEQAGEDGVTVSFDLSDFRVVAAFIKPRGCRRLDPDRRKAFINAGRPHRYGGGSGQNTILAHAPATCRSEMASDSVQ